MAMADQFSIQRANGKRGFTLALNLRYIFEQHHSTDWGYDGQTLASSSSLRFLSRHLAGIFRFSRRAGEGEGEGAVVMQ